MYSRVSCPRKFTVNARVIPAAKFFMGEQRRRSGPGLSLRGKRREGETGMCVYACVCIYFRSREREHRNISIAREFLQRHPLSSPRRGGGECATRCAMVYSSTWRDGRGGLVLRFVVITGSDAKRLSCATLAGR